MPQVSIVIVNFNYPHNITRLLPSLQKLTGVSYETVVVDNGSEPDVVKLLEGYKEQGLIDTLVLESVNHWFDEGNNIGVRNSDPASEFILLLNSDTEILHGDLLKCLVEWAEGLPDVLFPYPGSIRPARPKDIRRGAVSIDYGWDRDVPKMVRPEGWCCLIRKELWEEMDPGLPNGYGLMEMLANTVRNGNVCGVLSLFGGYIKHHVGGSHPPGTNTPGKPYTLQGDMVGWWAGLECETLDFSFGTPHQHQTYLGWGLGASSSPTGPTAI